MICDPKAWHDTLCRLQKEIPDFAYTAWIRPLAVKLSEDRIVLGCPSSFHRERVRVQFQALLEESLQAAMGFSDDAAGTPKIELVSMLEFDSMSGHTIEIEIPEVVSATAEQAVLGERRMLRCSGVQTVAQMANAGGGLATNHGTSARNERGEGRRDDATGQIPAVAPLVSSGGSHSHLEAVPHPPKSKRRPSSKSHASGPLSGRSKPRASQKTSIDQVELPFSFESFIVGPCNALAREAALALARTRQRSLNLLYLGGDSGMGKTHLARATAAEARRHSMSAGSARGAGLARASSTQREAHPTVIYTSAEKFTNDFVSAMRNGRAEDFKRRYRGPIGLLIVEDIQFFSGRVKTQLELFHTLQHVLDAGGRVLLTGDRSPMELTGLDDRVRSQVGQGFVAELEPPDAIVRRHILRSKAAAGGVRLPEDCLDLLVEASHGSVRDIESNLIQVVTTASLLGQPIDLALTEDAIALKASSRSALPTKTVAVSEIVRIVSAFFGKRPEALASKSRRRDVLVPRQLALYLAHRYTEASFAEIGRGLGRGHPSVRNAIERIERLVLENAPMRYQVEALSERIDSTLKNRRNSTSVQGE